MKDQEGYQVENLDEPLDLEEEIREEMVPGVDTIGIPELDALIKMPMPEMDPKEEVEREFQWQVMVRMRAFKWSRGEEVKGEVEMYEDLEPLLVQKMEEEKEMEKEHRSTCIRSFSNFAP